MVTVKPFGNSELGPVSLITLSDKAGISVELLSLGAAIRALTVPDRTGSPVDICLGYDTLEEYINSDGYLGASVGRYANRIGGAKFNLNGKTWILTANEGENQLHGGFCGFDKKLWRFYTAENQVTFELDSPHLEEGYPGDLHVEVTYSLLQPGRLDIIYRAKSTEDTVVNLTNHSYFNLSGQGSGKIDDHILTLQAEYYTPCRSGNIPTGVLAPVKDTPLDLQKPTRLGDRLGHTMLEGTRGYDHNLVLTSGVQKPQALLQSPKTGITMEVETTMPGIQLYTAGFLSPRQGKAGMAYAQGHGVCLETQHYPDSVNHPNFPSPVLRAGEEYFQKTSYRFFIQD